MGQAGRRIESTAHIKRDRDRVECASNRPDQHVVCETALKVFLAILERSDVLQVLVNRKCHNGDEARSSSEEVCCAVVAVQKLNELQETVQL